MSETQNYKTKNNISCSFFSSDDENEDKTSRRERVGLEKYLIATNVIQ